MINKVVTAIVITVMMAGCRTSIKSTVSEQCDKTSVTIETDSIIKRLTGELSVGIYTRIDSPSVTVSHAVDGSRLTTVSARRVVTSTDCAAVIDNEEKTQSTRDNVTAATATSNSEGEMKSDTGPSPVTVLWILATVMIVIVVMRRAGGVK